MERTYAALYGYDRPVKCNMGLALGLVCEQTGIEDDSF